jgi:hypothetical protein
VEEGVLQKGLGLVGDAHAGTEKEVSFLAMESIDRFLKIGEAKLMVIQIGKDPSQAHTYNYHGYSILPKEGLFCKGVESGEVKIEDPIRLITN